jgi:hypothetical protein
MRLDVSFLSSLPGASSLNQHTNFCRCVLHRILRRVGIISRGREGLVSRYSWRQLSNQERFSLPIPIKPSVSSRMLGRSAEQKLMLNRRNAALLYRLEHSNSLLDSEQINASASFSRNMRERAAQIRWATSPREIDSDSGCARPYPRLAPGIRDLYHPTPHRYKRLCSYASCPDPSTCAR